METAKPHSKSLISRRIWLVIAVETSLIVGLLLAFILIPGKKNQSRPQTVPVPKAVIAEGRLIVYSPLKNTAIADSKLNVSGRMKDFFEATMVLRVRDSSGQVKMTELVTATGDNYGKYAPFQQSFTIPDEDRGMFTVEFVEISMKDGGENVLLSIPVTFK